MRPLLFAVAASILDVLSDGDASPAAVPELKEPDTPPEPREAEPPHVEAQ